MRENVLLKVKVFASKQREAKEERRRLKRAHRVVGMLPIFAALTANLLCPRRELWSLIPDQGFC